MASPPVILFVSCDGDDIGREVGSAVLGDRPEDLARFSQAINRGQAVITSWALASGGSVLEAGGDEVTVQVPAGAIKDLEAARHGYFTAVGATLSVGVGRRLSEAGKSLMVAKLRGKDRVVFYDSAVEREHAEAAAKPQPTEAEKIGKEYLGKADGGHKPNLEELDSYVADEGSECGWCSKKFKDGEPMLSTGRSPHNWCSMDCASKGHNPNSKFSRFMGAGLAGAVKGVTAQKGPKVPTIDPEWTDYSDHPAAKHHLQNWPGVKVFVGPLWNGPHRVFALNMTNSSIEADRELGSGYTSGHNSFQPVFDEIERHHAASSFGVNAPGNKLQNSERPVVLPRMKKALPRTEGSAQHTSTAGATAPQMQTAEHSEAEVARTMGAVEQSSPHLDAFHAAATDQDKSDRAAAVQQSEDFQALKEQVAGALQTLRTQLPVLSQLKSSYPDTYKAVIGLVQSVVTLSRGLQTTDAELQKKEPQTPRPKVWRENTSGFGTPVSIPSASHPDRKAWDQNYTASIAESYSGGDTSALRFKDLDISRLDAGNSGRGVVNKDRYKLYHRMLSAGDRIPPVVVQKQGKRYQVVDGTHRLEAARAAGTSKIPTVEVQKTEFRKAISEIPAGRHTGVTSPEPDKGANVFSYDHVLSPQHRAAGYSVKVEQSKKAPEIFSAQLHHKGNRVGSVNAFVWGADESRTGSKAVEPHSELEPQHHGKGLGKALYEAAFAHAKQHHGVEAVEGGKHSKAASFVHQSLAQKHGFAYNPPDISNHSPNFPNGEYSYALKGEPEDLDDSRLDNLTFRKADPAVHAAGAPVGTTHNGKIKVRHADDTTSWKGVRAGLIQGLEPGAPLMGANSHPVSSREPNSK